MYFRIDVMLVEMLKIQQLLSSALSSNSNPPNSLFLSLFAGDGVS